MMNYSQTKRKFVEGLNKKGFIKKKGILLRETAEVAVMIVFRKGFGSQLNCDIGFWLRALGGAIPDKVEKSHIYVRIERLYPEQREFLLAAMDVGVCDQDAAMKTISNFLQNSFDEILNSMATLSGVAFAYRAGDFAHALISKDARQFLENMELGWQ
jgi:hypothetical protein